MNPIPKLRLPSFFIAIVAAVLTVIPVKAAERIDFIYGSFVFPLSVKELEVFAREGKIEPRLEYYLNRLNSQQQVWLRELLRSRYDISHITVSRITNTVAGEQVLRYLGRAIKTQSGQNGFYGIRAAAVLASANPEGLSVINFLRQFPTNIQVDIQQVLKLVKDGSTMVRETQQLMAKLNQINTEIAAEENPVNFAQLPDPRSPGSFRISQQTITVRDASRERELVVDLYLPEPASQSRFPVIIISNGLGGKRDRFVELARHLASYGFAVLSPDHPGSDRQRQTAFDAGLYRESFDATDYIDRPLDVTYLLDELERDPQFSERLNLQQVGIFGYSIGALTALSLAGAQINFEQLKETDCTSLKTLLNISQLYQCRALEIPQTAVNLQDDRIKAAFLFVPFTSILFGESGLNRVTIPLFWKATDTDILAPLLLEQIPAFTWLGSAEKYLAVSAGLPHTRVTLELTNRLTNQNLSASKMSAVTKLYHNVLSLAFFQVHLAENQSYHPYLQTSYMKVLSEPPYNLNLVQPATTNRLQETWRAFQTASPFRN